MGSKKRFPHTKQGFKLLGILRNNGAWMNRSAIADALEKPKLTHHDRALLLGLCEAGLIEIDTRFRDDVGLNGEYIYRAIDKEDS